MIEELGNMPMASPASPAYARLQPSALNRKISCFSGGAEYPDNVITTTKYTWITFAPKNLYEQYHKFGNKYFTVISVLMLLGEKTTLFIGTIKAFSTIATLGMMMNVTAVMALRDDRQRGKADLEINSKKVTALDEQGSPKEKLWSQVRVGDVLEIRADQELPADVVVIESCQEDGVVWVSTANLDGESNLKKKEALKETQTKYSKDWAKLRRMSIVAEGPKEDIYSFWGQHEDEGVETILGPDQLLLRGTFLKNTAWVKGVVVYTGQETRMVKNSRQAPNKQSTIEKETNKVMLLILASQFALAFISDLTVLYTKDAYLQYWYLDVPNLMLPDILAYLLTFVVLYSNLMPISLYPSMEFVNQAHAYYIKNDYRMLWQPDKANPPQEGPSFAADVRSSNLCQELGQIDYIFSDKTGTLTQNVMEFKRCSILKEKFGSLKSMGFEVGKGQIEKKLKEAKTEEKETIDKFWEILGVCHTVVASGDGPRKKYEAESPDEKSLVEAAAEMGWAFEGRKGTTMTVKTVAGPKTYEFFAENKFDSTRKRMSVMVEHQGKYLLLAKGADNVMKERAANMGDWPEQHLTEFSEEGLRTLILGYKELSKEAFDAWMAKYRLAQQANSEEAMAVVAEEVEKDLIIVGATAIEDKLQERVADVIESVRKAGIKLWILTGDKLETAKNIGFSAKVLSSNMIEETLDIETLVEPDASPTTKKQVLTTRLEDLYKKFDAAAKAYKDTELAMERENKSTRQDMQKKLEKQTTALIVTGATLKVITVTEEVKSLLADVSRVCRVVIACRVSPLQKAEMVTLVKESVKLEKGGRIVEPVTLAIGDGANDVPMIQAAHVGIGMAGKEGRQAVNNSDVALGQFEYIERLLLVHGRWNYRRICKFALFTFWRNAVQVLMIFYYTFISGFSGTSLFEDWIRLSFNFLCSVPIIAVGCFDQDVAQERALEEPDLYECGRRGLDLNPTKMLHTLLSAVAHSMILLGVTTMSFPSLELADAGDYYTYGTAVYSCLILDMSYRVLFLAFNHNKYTTIAVVGSVGLYMFYLFVYADLTPFITDKFEPNMWNVPRMMMVPMFWVICFVVPLLAMTLDVFMQEVRNVSDPYYHRILEARKLDAAQARALEAQPARPEKELGAASKFIDTSDFAQQSVPYWNVLTVKKTVMPIRSGSSDHSNGFWLSMLMGFVCLVMAGVMISSSAKQVQMRIHYHGNAVATNFPLDPIGTTVDGKMSEIVKPKEQEVLCELGNTCTVEVTWIHPDTRLKDIHVFYALGPFYQNYNSYIKSEVPLELAGKPVPDGMRELRCPSLDSRVDKESGNDLVPCGMKAASFFNDTFSFGDVEVDDSTAGWNSDRDRYNNQPPDYMSRNRTTWLWDRFPQIKAKDGVKNRHFVEWMRPSALWRVWKSYGVLKPPPGNHMLMKGEKINVTISNHYHMPKEGYKHLVLTTLGPFGGRNHGFGYLLGFSSVVSFLIAVWTTHLRKNKHICCCNGDHDHGEHEQTTALLNAEP